MNVGAKHMGAGCRRGLREARNAWAVRYMITSVRGRVYTHPMVRRAIIRALENETIFTTAAAPRRALIRQVDVLLSDDRWMLTKRGQTPGSLASDAVKRLISQ